MPTRYIPYLTVVTTRLFSSARAANNARSTLPKDSSQHPSGINIQAINPFNHTRFYLFWRCALRSPLSYVEQPFKPADCLSPRTTQSHSATSHRRTLDILQTRWVQTELFDPPTVSKAYSHQIGDRHVTQFCGISLIPPDTLPIRGAPSLRS